MRGWQVAACCLLLWTYWAWLNHSPTHADWAAPDVDAPYGKKEEETRRFVEFGYYKSEIEKLVRLQYCSLLLPVRVHANDALLVVALHPLAGMLVLRENLSMYLSALPTSS